MRRPRLGFVGVGWIGRNRMEAIAAADIADIVAVSDVSPEVAGDAASSVAADVAPVDDVLRGAGHLDGVVVATPSSLHAEQSITALSNGLAVFCQKPLARTASECAEVVAAAQKVDRLLGIDLSYRHVQAVTAIRSVLDSGGIGDVYAAELTFHNAYGPDKPWFVDPAQSGGGCVIDLGIHLVDLALWLLDGPKVEHVTSRLFAKGRALPPAPDLCEDYAVARLDLATGGTVSMTCSWFLHAGCDAVIEATFHGTEGSVALRNIDGSFYDFVAVRRNGTSEETLVSPPDDWGGRAAVAWARQLADDRSYDAAVADVVTVAEVLDRVYGR